MVHPSPGMVNPPPKHDPVNHPKHYASHPSGVECITISKFYCFCIGNVFKYIWRFGQKDNSSGLEDLKKARWYLDEKIRMLENGCSEEYRR